MAILIITLTMHFSNIKKKIIDDCYLGSYVEFKLFAAVGFYVCIMYLQQNHT